MILNRLSYYVFIFVVMSFGAASLFLQVSGTQYIISSFLILFSGFIFFISKNKMLSVLDVGWVSCLFISTIYVIYALYNGRTFEVVVWQALMFFMPLTQYMVRFLKVDITIELLVKFLILVSILKVPTFLINIDDVVMAMSSISERHRFHDYVSVFLIFLLFPVLLYFRSVSFKLQVVVFTFFIIFLVSAAHRSAYMAVLAQLSIWFFTYSGVAKVTKFRVLAVIVMLLFYYLFFTSSGAVMLALANDSIAGVDANSTQRIDLSAKVLSGWLTYFWGHGFGYEFMYGFDARGDSVFYTMQHNSLLTPLYYLGVVPAILFMSSIVYLFLAPVRCRMQAYFRSSLIGMCVFSYFNLWFENPLFAIPYWILFGVFKFSSRK